MLVSIRGTRTQVAAGLRVVGKLVRDGATRIEWGDADVGSGEFDVLTVPDAAQPRIRTAAVIAADDAGILAMYDPDQAAESAARQEGDGVSGL